MTAGREAIQIAAGLDEKPVRMSNTNSWNPTILIKSPSENESLLDKKHLLKMDELETKLKGLQDWPLFCKAQGPDDLSCSDQSIQSPIAYLVMFAGKDWKEKTQEELDLAFEKLRANKQMWPQLKFLFNKEENIDESDGVSYMRYFFSFGAPLDMSSNKDLNDQTKDGVRYRDYTDRTDE